MIQLQKLAIANKSKGQISSKYLGNIGTEIYQYGCQYVSNAMIYPNGSTRKRSGTRYVCPAFDGADTRLFVVGNFVAMLGKHNLTFIYGRKPVLSERTANPTITKSGSNLTINNVHTSDVLHIQNDTRDASSFFTSFSASAYTVDNSYPDFYFDRRNQDYDTSLRLILDKNKNFTKSPAVSDISITESDSGYTISPDVTEPLVPTAANPSTFPSLDLSALDSFNNVHAVYKVPLSVLNYKITDPNGNKYSYEVLLDYYASHGNIINIATLATTSDQRFNGTGTAFPWSSMESMRLKVPDVPSPEFFKSDIVNDFRVEYLDQDIENIHFKMTAPYSKNQASPVVLDKQYWVSDIPVPAAGGVTNLSPESKFIEDVKGMTIFQGRLVMVGLGREDHTKPDGKKILRLYFSAINDYSNFKPPTGTSTPEDPFYLDLDPNKFRDLNMIHEFANDLILGTDSAIYSLFSGSGLVEPNKPIEIIKISDVGTAPAQPTLHNNNLYVVANNRQSLMKLTKEPLSVLISAKRILTLSDVHNTNGYIKKVINWMWDYQYIGVVTSDGMFLKMNIDAENENFNIWNADKGLILDAVKFTPKSDEDILYFVVHREGDTTIEIAFNNQEIPKYYHHYSVFRSRVEEDENKNRMRNKVLPNFVKNGFYADCAMTLRPKTDFKTVSIAGDTATFSGGYTGIKDDDMIVIDDKQFVIISFDSTTKKAEIENQGGYNFTDAEFSIKRKNFLASEYPMLHMFKNKNNIAIYGDGKSFYTSRYDNFNEDTPSFALNGNCDLLMNGYFSELTIGYVYRFLYVTTPITSAMSLEPSKPHTVNNLRVYMNFSYHIDFGMEPDKLDPIRLDKQNPIFGCQWFDLVNFNASGDTPNSLILKNDYPCPTEIVSINLSYSG